MEPDRKILRTVGSYASPFARKVLASLALNEPDNKSTGSPPYTGTTTGRR
jgi:hypothetical protein